MRTLIIVSFVSSFLPITTVSTQAATQPGYWGKIAYTAAVGGYSDIFIAHSDGSDAINITSTPGVSESRPKVSPDGTSVIYYSGSWGSLDVYKRDIDGSNLVQITSTAGNDYYGVWSPASNAIAYQSDSAAGGYVVDRDGSNVRPLISGGTACNCYDLEWSSDGSKIYFAGDADGDVNYDIYSVNSDGSNLQKLTSLPDGWDIAFDVSPDETKIIYSRQNSLAGGQQTIYLFDLDDSSTITITTGADNEYNPIWSPDGKQFAYENWDQEKVYIVDATTLASFALDVVEAYSPNWTPDGKYLAVTGYDPSKSALFFNVKNWEMEQQLPGVDTYYMSYFITPNTLPVTADDTLVTPYNTTGMVDVLTNDDDEEALDGQYLTITAQPLNGTAAVVDGKVKYVPNDGFKGEDELTYQICDSFLLDQKCATANLSITVQAPGAPTLAVSKVGDTKFDGSTPKYTSTTAKPTFSGTASPGAEIQVEIHSDPILLTTTTDSSGNWLVVPTSDLPSGEHEVFISATLNGVTTELDSFVLAITDESTIPNTGASTWPLRVGGAGFTILGLGLAYWQRRRIERLVITRVPPLWP